MFGWGTGEDVMEMHCGNAPGAEAHERWGSQALSRARHGGGEVAAAELDWAAWQGEERSSAKGSEARRSQGCRVWRWSSRRWHAALHSGVGATLLRRQVKQRGREVEEDCWVFLQIPKSSGIPL